ncbi:MAG: tetratricopeptide repeat protein [Candidatus Thorarchaeota archaeon]|jgi:tetratricopeptide (TPR) repeat protein
MKPFGTITKYYPFVETESKSVLESTIQKAHNYDDFISLLGETICNQNATNDLVFTAISHATNVNNYRLIKRIIEHYTNLSVIKPYHTFIQAVGSSTYLQEIRNHADKAIEEGIADWLEFDMQYWRWLASISSSVGSIIEEESLNRMEEIINSNPLMKCFEYVVHSSRARRAIIDGRVKESLKLRQIALESALNYDDKLVAAIQLRTIAYIMRNFDSSKALELLQQAESITDELGFVHRTWEIPATRGSIYDVRGEFNAAIDAYLIALERLERLDVNTVHYYLPHNISLMYGEIGHADAALEWARMALESHKFITTGPGAESGAHFRISRALILTGNVVQAQEHLDKGKKLALKVGRDRSLVEEFLLTGRILIAQGDYLGALESFEDAFSLSKQIELQSHVNYSLLGLVETELALSDSDMDHNEDFSGEWMEYLENRVRIRDIPGIQGLHLFHKAKFRFKQGRNDDAIQLLREAQELAQSHGLEFLEEKILSVK